MFAELATFMRDRVYDNTKRGYYGGVTKNLAKFKPLSEGYVRSRMEALKGRQKESKRGVFGTKRSASAARKRALKKFGPFFSPKRSNLTYTGDMLENLESTYDARNRTVRAFVRDSARDDDSGLTNKQVAIKVSEAGRPFPTIDVRGINTMTRKIIASIRRSLRGSRR